VREEAMENEWTKKIKELTESRDQWKLEWGLLMSDLNAANDRNTELEAALKRETNEYIEASHTLIIERDEAREQVKKLEAERDADRKREYGYSQQTVDALTLERDKLRAERNDWKSRYQSVSEMHDALIAEFNEMRAENKRLREQVNATIELLECAKINVDNIKKGGVIFCELTKMQIDEAIMELSQALAGKEGVMKKEASHD
jgi:uncharacterized coiled-coil DUF342 family protein